ncbi:hypothetical protein D1BOALGB6SA_1708 [Olavius sp. associated proteobacterium Delta 1]|nr:hypothetical protein D1BOALGB6SA_1708 [Olavius sp. associated proteobacterium Delta 1]
MKSENTYFKLSLIIGAILFPIVGLIAFGIIPDSESVNPILDLFKLLLNPFHSCPKTGLE